MAEQDTFFGPSDLRAAVAAGILTEAQAAQLGALAHDRAGKRAALPAEDEPFEFFRGFAEIFVASGLAILLGGIALLLGVVGGITTLILLPAVMASIAWWLARYFTLKRRMNLPSMVLVSAFAAGIYVSALTVFGQTALTLRAVAFLAAALAAAATALWFRRFKLPFAMFVFGIFALMATYALFTRYGAGGGDLDSIAGWARSFVPRTELTVASLLFGILAFAGAMWFDLRDRYRIGRHSATAFWLHVLAGATLVNTIAGRLYAGGSGSLTATAMALIVFAFVALVVDRRSILTAGIAYIAALIYWVVAEDGGGSPRDWAVVLILLGAFFTVLGTWWVPLRASIMRRLPDFPGKDRLPPYSESP
ncbi:MAG: hypothetical protein ACK4NE_04010 [Albidovulum sp.]